jgi:hypothetical protein
MVFADCHCVFPLLENKDTVACRRVQIAEVTLPPGSRAHPLPTCAKRPAPGRLVPSVYLAPWPQ